MGVETAQGVIVDPSQVPASLALPIIWEMRTQTHKGFDEIRITLADGGVWLLDIDAIEWMPYDIAGMSMDALFAAHPSYFRFVKRERPRWGEIKRLQAKRPADRRYASGGTVNWTARGPR